MSLSSLTIHNIYLLRRRLDNVGMKILKNNLKRKNKSDLKLENDISYVMEILRSIESSHELKAYHDFISQVVDQVYLWENKALEKERK